MGTKAAKGLTGQECACLIKEDLGPKGLIWSGFCRLGIGLSNSCKSGTQSSLGPARDNHHFCVPRF